MENVPKNTINVMPSSSILSIIGGSLIIIGGLIMPLAMLGMSGHYGMMMSSRFGTGGMMGGGYGMMMPFSPFMWWTAMALIPVISIATGVILIIGGYSIYRSPESASGE